MLTGDCVCDAGFAGGALIATQSPPFYSGAWDDCENDGSCCRQICTNATEVANSDRNATGSIAGVEGDAVAVYCNAGHSGSAVLLCSVGSFSTTVGEFPRLPRLPRSPRRF